MEKLMTTLAKTKNDILKDALKEAERMTALEEKDVKTPVSKAKKRGMPQPKKVSSLPWQKSDQNQSMLKAFHQSCDHLKNLITTGFHNISTLVSQKHIRVVNKVKHELVDYMNTHRHLEQVVMMPSLDNNEIDLPWQKHDINLSEEFRQSCDALENLLMTGFDRLFEEVSRKHREALEALKEDLLTYLNESHRPLKPVEISKSVPKPELKKETKTSSSEDTLKDKPTNPTSETSSTDAVSEIVVPAEK